MPSRIGSITTTIIEKAESHKLHQAFVVSGTAVFKGQPVKLNANGTISPYVAADAENVKIGVAIMDGAVGEEVTVSVKGHMITNGLATGALAAGPVEYSGVDANGVCQYVVSSAATKTIGYNLTQVAGAGSIQVLHI